MSRDYGRVYGTFWSSKTTASMTDDGKLLALYLMTCTHNTIAGVFRLPDGYVTEDMGWEPERVAQGFEQLFDKGFAVRCESTKWVFVKKHLEWNKPENPNQRKSAAKIALSVPDECAWKQEFLSSCADVLGIEPPSANPFETVTGTVSVTLSKPGTEAGTEAEAGTGTQEPPIPPKGGRALKTLAVSLPTWLATVRAKGEKPIPEGDPILAYADEVGLPFEFLTLAWREFRARYSEPGAKRYSDWRAVFRKAVRGNWLKLWWLDGKEFALTTVGMQAQRAHAKEAA
jgi:hypothetical protein